LPGVVRTRVGYAGGTTQNPTYEAIGDHAETIQIEYDQARITFEELLAVFWDSHSPVTRPYSRQYMSILFYHTDEQRRLAEESKAREEAERGRALYTEIMPARVFTPAENYHQKYALQHERQLMAELRAIYPRMEDLIASTAAARINGYLGGHGSVEQFRAEIGDLGLSDDGRQRLAQRVGIRLGENHGQE
jgi:peptide-methionine (S)-S-oxide reductase